MRQIFRYLAEAGESRVKPVRSLEQARHVLWLSDMPYGTPELQCFLAAPLSGDEPCWLAVERPPHREAPAPGGLLADWLDATEAADCDRERPPALRAETELPGTETGPDDGETRVVTTVALESFPRRVEVEAEYQVWAGLWAEWAEWRRATRPIGRLYESLYRIHEDASALGESYELVLCFGYLTWSAGEEPIRRHLLTGRAVLDLDVHTGRLVLTPDPESPGLVLEEGMLDANQKVRSDTREVIRRSLEDAGAVTEQNDIEYVHQALEAWAIAAHQNGRYLRQEAQHRSSSAVEPRVSFAPALVLRERSRRTNIDALQGIARAIEQGAGPTDLLRFIAGHTEDGNGQDPQHTSTTPDGPVETYFALPSNEEQRTIAERLRAGRLVVVQGPPGTGKTHTIANLVTDLLAQGQRVLITSHTARALKVLKDKLPASIRELCVSRTDDGLAAQQELRGSIQAILERQGSYERRAYQRRIDNLEQRLRGARTAQALALTELRAIREQETYQHPVEIGDYQGTLQEIAHRLAAEEPVLGWLGPVPTASPGVTSDQVRALREASAAYTPQHRVAVDEVAELPAEGEILGAAAFEQDLRAVQKAEQGLAALRHNDLTDRLDGPVARLAPDAQQRVSAALETYSAARTATATLPGWAEPLRAEALGGDQWQLRSRHRTTVESLQQAKERAAALNGCRVDGLEAHDVATALRLATTLRDGLAAGEKLRGPLGLKPKLRKAVGDFPETVRVDGLAVDNVEAATKVLARVELERHLQDVEQEWEDATAPWQALTRRLARLESAAAVLDGLMVLVAARTGLLDALAPVPELTVRPWHLDEECRALGALLTAREALRGAEAPKARLAATEQALVAWADRADTAAAPVRLLLRAVRESAAEAYREHSDALAGLRTALELKARYEAARQPVAAVLPELAQQLGEDPGADRWTDRIRAFERAWAWSAWSERMRELTDPAAEEKQRKLLAEADGDIRIALEKLAADRSWFGCLERLTDGEAVALASYQQSVSRFGKGTGKHAHRYRVQAMESLKECQGAVPAWIMPLYQVTATVPMDRAGRFDVVIIDEASQSGPEALLLAWLGKKIIVVGDDKQVSPANVGLDQDQRFQLQNRLLEALPASRRNLFSPMASFFDIATGLAGGRGRLMLQEHFRCMPEIIGFSNELSYHGRLQPLRQFGADRLPPIRTTYVPSAYVDGTGQRQYNRAEAEQLVDQVVRCCTDPAYQGRTMGVITMLGSGQKQLIEDLLSERLPVDVRQQRKIRIGDAEDFQGDERDIVFISLVISLAGDDGPRRPGPFASEAMQQRLNVAASRARDQVWVFHSVTATDLGPNDLRRKYLEYCLRPADERRGPGPEDVRPDVRHEDFDSLFEQRVYLALRGRGYQVRPQYPAGRYRIDLVVEGGTRRLAVECDGDAFHNEENADADAARQRELERVGWTFVRIRGSRFFLDPERALEPLWAELDRLGISPGGFEDAADGEATESTGGADELHVLEPDPSAAPAPTPAVPAADVPGRSERPVFPVTVVSVNSYRRAQRELTFLEDRIASPAELGPAVDGAALAARRAAQDEARQRDEERRAFLRTYLDQVTPDQRLTGVGVVVPGCLIGVEHEGDPETVLYTISTAPSTEAQRISPNSDLGRALLWCEVGEHLSYQIGRDGTERAVVRFIED
ncbi:AAA domain-containing protein [Kitasatospora sp. YST-16]|uniref:AAA domain-containing protein n=1 Tax=Kitasatospora sp. YST-16 TaxID=2998080 RepID=UPI00228383D3|nr:AAA domain-containing protein [Kitasatospora sp. YST-16]WAL72280.1 AAA domain-containing protein [Kitasatospora sp. YST-16]